VTLTHILVFSILALIASWLIPKRWRVWFLLTSSLLSVYWLQPSSPLRNLDFWLPTAAIFLTGLVWNVTQTDKAKDSPKPLITTIVILGIILLVGLSRYADIFCCLTATRPPDILRVLIGLGIGIVISTLPYLLPNKRIWPTASILFILLLFITLKTAPLAQGSSAAIRSLSDQAVDLASSLDLIWLGFSYLAFRLIHVLRDYQTGKLPSYSLEEFITYALFFPTYTAGPIDRSQRFMGDLRNQTNNDAQAETLAQKQENLFIGGQRILIGIFKKFVLADSLALIALNEQNASQVSSTFWMWMLLLAYSLRIYFDFSGYTDIALGLGRLINFKLPENFNRPYFKINLTEFWNSWHMTLAQWFRAYFFFPLTRALRTKSKRIPAWGIILAGQFSTMVLIGLWHGVTWNFFIWGVWHGLGLFIHNRWADWTRPKISNLNANQKARVGLEFSSWLLTFIFVTLGWVWFALPNLNLSLEVLRVLFFV
jgi:alginate O-acetyltransferase complex protein AlgI